MLPGIAGITGTAALYLIITCWKSYRPQHAGGGEGALTVWQLIAHVEAERQQREQGGRHRLREPQPPPPSTSDAEKAPSLEVQRRILDALRRL
ncbi:hypothetical protein [Saccharopolyspora shandongensis]|uniref:hypothetical protein n=1 Tax=Saccharopolyspora shandongensis TaxID=418495 RepID=UPI000B258A5D|nr:hypothetical protein [Saccharopolyspora shandongensis]